MLRIIAWLIVFKDIAFWGFALAVCVYGLPIFWDRLITLGNSLGWWTF